MIVLCTTYQPGPRLPEFAQALLPETSVLLVDDGSDPPHQEVLDRAEALGCEVLRHGRNRGKGAALKTGLRHIVATRPGQDVACADPDGQHRPEDVLRVAERVRETGTLVLGARAFDGDVPVRRRLGNTLTRHLFRLATGRDVRDTQTGLRGLPASLLDRLIAVPGERFDYEMNMLLQAAASGEPIEQVGIDTRYLDEPGTSHFGSISDSVRIYQPLLRVAASSLTGRRR